MRRTSLLPLPAFLLLATLARGDDPKPPTLGEKPPEGAVVLFGGKDLAGWTTKDSKGPAEWPVEDGILIVGGKGDIRTEKAFGSFKLHVEFNVPYMPKAKGQGRGNSGVYLQGNYELQVLDSYGLTMQTNDCGAIYQQIIPSVNACLPPLRWQTYDITFTAAKDGKKARLTVVHNGITTIDDKEISPTPGGLSLKEGEDGPILLQDHGNPVMYRNIWIAPKTD